jgi:hypothetical protein
MERGHFAREDQVNQKSSIELPKEEDGGLGIDAKKPSVYKPGSVVFVNLRDLWWPAVIQDRNASGAVDNFGGNIVRFHNIDEL